jgi:hypothetical protein
MRKFALHFAVLFAFALAAWSQQPASGDPQASSSSQTSASPQEANPSGEHQGSAHHSQMSGKSGGTAHVTGCLSGPNAEGAYELTSGKHKVEVGGNDELKNHVGHKVTVTGEWASAADIGESQAAEKNEKGEKAEKHLKATSIKMVSESCEKAASSKKSY